VKFQVRTPVLMKTGLFWGVTTLAGKEVLTFREDVIDIYIYIYTYIMWGGTR